MTGGAPHDRGDPDDPAPLNRTNRGGRKLVISPEGEQPWAPPEARVDSTLVKALARAFRWRRQLETGVHACLRDIAKAKKINESYVARVLRMILLVPEHVERPTLNRECKSRALAVV